MIILMQIFVVISFNPTPHTCTHRQQYHFATKEAPTLDEKVKKTKGVFINLK